MTANRGPVPVLDAIVALKLDAALAQLENAQLKIQLLQARARAMQDTINQLVQAAERDGYVLRRLEDGTFAYTPVPEEVA
jgi:hypothetical protein